MATENLTEYERRRLENIRRNDEMMASLKIRSRLSELSAASKRQRIEKKSYKVSPEKSPKVREPVVLRRSLRTRGIPPTTEGLDDKFIDPPLKPSKEQSPSEPSPRVLGPLSIADAYTGSSLDQPLIRTICKRFGSTNGSLSNSDDESVGVCGNGSGSVRVKGSVELGSLSLNPENIAKVLPGKILAVKFLPTVEMTVIVSGNKYGEVGLWNVEPEKENDNDNGIYLYHPHSAAVSGILVQPFSLTKIYTSSYDGLVRLMDLEKEVFDLVHSGDDAIFSIAQPANNADSVYFGDSRGLLNVWDVRAGKASASWSLHGYRINTIDFNSANTEIMATSSTDGTVSLWDLRQMGTRKPKAFRNLDHKRGVQSAYFSPSGSCVATTSYDDNVGLLSGANFEDEAMIYHYNQTGRWIAPFRAIWGWDDSQIYMGSMRRGVDVLSTAQKRMTDSLRSDFMTAIPCRFDAHPCKVGMLAGATSGGQIYIWSST